MSSDAADNRIRAALEAGDLVALTLVWDHYADDLFALLLSVLGSWHDAEDVLQEVFMKIARRRQLVATARNLRSYLLGMARHEAINLINRRPRHDELTDAAAPWLEPTDSGVSAPEMAQKLAVALAALPEEQRTVVTLKVFREMTFQGIADALDIPPDTAASRYRYGLKKLRTLMRDERP